MKTDLTPLDFSTPMNSYQVHAFDNMHQLALVEPSFWEGRKYKIIVGFEYKNNEYVFDVMFTANDFDEARIAYYGILNNLVQAKIEKDRMNEALKKLWKS